VNIGLDRLAPISDASVYPNPFDSRVKTGTIAFTLNSNSAVSITIYDAFGRKVKSLGLAGVAGANSIAWDGTGSSGGKVSMGMYICVIKAGGNTTILKVGVKH
jgi:flagellar hook assembly protein FlgD